jgi:small subunit ribosomal protein S6
LSVNVYEGMFILDSNRYARDPGGSGQKITKLIEDHGGEILVSRLWNEQKLAYPIKGQKKGAYWLTYFRMDGVRLDEMNHQAKLNDLILRSLVIKLDPRIVEALVAHVQAGETSNANGDDDDGEDGKEEAETVAAAKDA